VLFPKAVDDTDFDVLFFSGICADADAVDVAGWFAGLFNASVACVLYHT